MFFVSLNSNGERAMLGAKIVVWVALGLGLAFCANWYVNQGVEKRNADYYRQFDNDDSVPDKVRADHANRNVAYIGAIVGWATLGVLFFWGDLSRVLNGDGPSRMRRFLMAAFAVFVVTTNVCCYRPFEPVELETIDTSEEGFLIPLRGDGNRQSSTNSEEDLKKSLVTTKQVQIPQQWVQKGYETMGANGAWQPAARLIKVNRAPVTREWTADPNSGTSNKNEAIWVMTSDQVEFSTGWTITARIASREDAIKFLHNYPNGSLKQIMDTEVRSKLQAVFGLEVTDLPMDELRRAATPHIEKTTKTVSTFFKERGITITNIGITGGFVYKDPSIMKTMVDIFNAEQEKTKAKAATDAQEEKNKRLSMEASGKAQALMTEKKAEAEGIKAVADAKAYEIEKAAQQGDAYITLKRLDIEREKLKVWDGRFPQFYMGTGGQAPDMLLNIPTFPTPKAK